MSVTVAEVRNRMATLYNPIAIQHHATTARANAARAVLIDQVIPEARS